MLLQFYGQIFIENDEIENWFGPKLAAQGSRLAVRWARDVYGLLFAINSSDTGRVIFDAISASGPNVKIRPVFDLNGLQLGSGPPTDTRAVPLDTNGAFPKGVQLESSAGVRGVGTGAGSGSIVRFSPSDAWARGDPRLLPEDVLLHEICHSLRQVRGLSLPISMAYEYDDEEEFLAILITNIFASECGRPHSIRADHSGVFHELNMGVKDPKDPGYFYRIHKDVIDGQADRAPSMATLFRKLAEIQTPFNPLAAWRDAMAN